MGLERDSFFCRSRLQKYLARAGKQEQGHQVLSIAWNTSAPNINKNTQRVFLKKVKYAESFDRGESIPCQLTIKTVCAEPLFAGGILEESCKRPCEHPFEDEEIHSCSQEERCLPIERGVEYMV